MSIALQQGHKYLLFAFLECDDWEVLKGRGVSLETMTSTVRLALGGVSTVHELKIEPKVSAWVDDLLSISLLFTPLVPLQTGDVPDAGIWQWDSRAPGLYAGLLGTVGGILWTACNAVPHASLPAPDGNGYVPAFLPSDPLDGPPLIVQQSSVIETAVSTAPPPPAGSTTLTATLRGGNTTESLDPSRNGTTPAAQAVSAAAGAVGVPPWVVAVVAGLVAVGYAASSVARLSGK